MVTAKSIRIDPLQVSPKGIGARSKASITGTPFGDILSIAGALAPTVGEMTYQSTGNSNAASVLHSAFSALPGAYAAGGGGMGAYGMGSSPGMYGTASYSTVGGGMGGYGASSELGQGGSTQMGQPDQAQLIDTMNQNNLHLLELQAVMQNNMQQWTTKSNIYKSIHDAKMAIVQHFAAR